jgi:hypothetical protein
MSEVTKNELVRSMVDTGMKNQLKFSWVLFDSWFTSVGNMEPIKLKHSKDFIGALTGNRLVALNEEDRATGCFIRIAPIAWPKSGVITGWLKGLSFQVRLARWVFTNQDGSIGTWSLACSQVATDWDTLTTSYQKRWQVEVFHQSLKSNAALAKFPARRINAQANPIFASRVAVFKMACLTIRTQFNPVALCSKRYLNAIRSAFDELQALKFTVAA